MDFLRFLGCFCLSALLLAVTPLKANPATASEAAQQSAPQRFPISFWCGPPDKFLTIERFQEIKDAGFTHVMPPCGGASSVERNRKILDLCGQTGLKSFVADSRMTPTISGVGDAKARLDAIVGDYKTHPALAGYSITDEPGAGAFPGLSEVTAYLHERDPAHPAYINLFPNYANAAQMGVPTYEQYMRSFVEQVKPAVLSYDHYHFTTGGDGPLFFANLATARKVAAQFGLPFWQIVLAVQHGPYRNLTEGELRYEAMQTLAYGGKGLMWFTYWQPDDPSFQWSHAMINLDGSHDPHYDMVKGINGEVGAIGQQLLKATSTGVLHAGRVPPGAIEPPAESPIRFAGPGDFTVGLFRNEEGKKLALIANADYRNGITTELMVSTGNSRLQRFNQWTGQWQFVSGAQAHPDGDIMVALHLPPGGAALLAW